MPVKLARLLPFLLLIPLSAYALEPLVAGPADWQLGGYLKSFTSMTQGAGYFGDLGLTDRETFWNNTTRARVRSDLALGEVVNFVVHYEAFNQIGDDLRLRHEAQEQIGPLPFGKQILAVLIPQTSVPELFNLDHQLSHGDEYNLSHRLDRLFMRMHLGPWNFTLGRSALTWGPGKIWNPTDYIAGFAPTEIDKEEKLGVDLAHARVALAPTISLEGYAAPVRKGPNGIDTHGSAAAARLNVNALHTDWGLSGGWIYDRSIVGLDIDATIGDAGLRGALTRTAVDGVPGKLFWQSLVNFDYAFNCSWNPYLAAEYFYNGYGETDPEKYPELLQRPEFARAAARRQLFTVGVHYFGLIFNLQPHALVTLSDMPIVNILDHSMFNYFSVTWSVIQNLDLQVGAQNGLGPIPSEYGGSVSPFTAKDVPTSDLYFAYLKFYY